MKRALAEPATLTLPIMPATARALGRLLGHSHSNNQQLQQVLLHDPAATIALFRLIENIRPGAGANITDPAHALSLIGHGRFAQMLADLPVCDGARLDSPNSPRPGYSQAAHAACYARAIGERTATGGLDEIATAALLQNPAVLALWHRDAESATRANNAVRDGVPFDQAFSAELGEPLSRANQRLASAWHFPRLASDCMGNWDPLNRRAQSVMLGDVLAQASSAGWEEQSTLLNAEILEDILGIDSDAALAWWRQTAAAAARQLHALGYPTAAYQLVMLPGGEEPVEVPELGKKTATSPPTPPAAAAPTDLQGAIAAVMRRMLGEAGVQRLVFAILNPDRTELRARLALGGDKQARIRRFRLATRQRNLFSLLLGKQQSIWINPDNRSKYAPYLKGLPLDQGAAGGFYAMSIFVRDKPVGLLYADGASLSQGGYRRFRQLCHETSQVLDGRRAAA